MAVSESEIEDLKRRARDLISRGAVRTGTLLHSRLQSGLNTDTDNLAQFQRVAGSFKEAVEEAERL